MESRTVNSVRNILFGAINRCLSIAFPFLARTVIIKILGEEYLGLNSLFSSILQVLSVAELGFGSAISASMYKPIAENDIRTVSGLLWLYRYIYHLIGIGILSVGIILMPFLPHLINGEPPSGINIYVLFTLYLCQTVCSYLFYAYKITLINAHQRNDLTEKVGSISKTITSILQIVAIVVLNNIILYVLLNVVCTLIYNLTCSHITDKKYPQYTCKGSLSEEMKLKIKKNVVALALHKIGNTISVSLDTIIISMFLNLGIVAIYGNYNYVISAVSIFVGLIYSSITASIGNSIVVETKEKNYHDFEKFTFMNTWFVGWCACCFICIFQNFMEIWMGNNLLFPMPIIFLMVFCFFITQFRRVVQTYKDGAGMWCADKYKPLIGCIVNLILNIILVRKIGVSGVIISTIISYLFIELPWETHVLFKYFQKSEIIYYIKALKMLICISFSSGVTYLICIYMPNGVVGLILRILICCIVPNGIIIALNYRTPEFQEMKKFALNINRIFIKQKIERLSV